VTTPDQPGGQWPQQPGQWPPGQQPQGGYPQGTPQYGYPQQPTPPQGYPPPGPEGYPQTQYYGQPGYPPPAPAGKSKRGLVIGLVIALVVLAGGGVGTWFALSGDDSGAATPTEAVMNLANSVGNGDVVGLLSSLSPAEASLFTDPVTDVTNELKRLKILDESADPKALSGLQITTANLTFDEAAAEQVNDHVTITKLTGGTITITSDPAKLPLGGDLKDQVPSAKPDVETIDIAEEVRDSGEPVRLATVKVDGEWYPSLLYTIADYALKDAGQKWPSTSIPAAGAASANDAVKQLVQAALDADVRRVIELLPPDEMAVLHDAGPAILDALGDEAEPSGAKILDLQTQTSEVRGGTRATVTSVRIQAPSGAEFSVRKDGDCYAVEGGGENQRLCAEDLSDQIESQTGELLPSAVVDVLDNLGSGILAQGVGVITTEVDGKHYVSPVRTFVEQGLTILRSLKPEDITALLRAAN